MRALRERFETFIETFDGFENVDMLLKGTDLPGKNRADYLLRDREIIVEQKTLEVDPAHRPTKFGAKLMEEGRILAYGTVPVRAFSESIQREFVLDLTKNLAAIVAKADKQTKDTREIFSIPDAMGVLVILNEKAKVLEPRVVHYGLASVFQKRSVDGSLRYPRNDGVILISEAHAANTPNGVRIPIVPFTSPHGKANEQFTQFCDIFFEAWARFNGVPLIKLNNSPLQHPLWAGDGSAMQNDCIHGDSMSVNKTA
jgi:hypothetical protein